MSSGPARSGPSGLGRRPARTATEAQAITAPTATEAPIPPIWTARQAAQVVRAHAARRYEEAKALFETLEFGFRVDGERDHEVGFHAELACHLLCEAERSLVNAILASSHAGDLNPRDDYEWEAHEPVFFVAPGNGKVYGVIPDPRQDLGVGARGWAGPAMILTVRDDPASARAGA